MGRHRQTTAKFNTVRTLVRYVDEDRSVIDTVFALSDSQSIGLQPVEVHFRLTGPKGKEFTCQSHVDLSNESGMMRCEIDQPRRWWPAGMGDQNLYDLCLTLLVGDESIDTWRTTLGMTSVRTLQPGTSRSLLVNGQRYDIDSVVTIESDDEESVLAVSGDTLLLVRDHFGPDVLYDAADRVGILLVQSVPLRHQKERGVNVRREVDRLVAHPSLAGWFVDSAGRTADRIARRIHLLDPTRKIFRHLPQAC